MHDLLVAWIRNANRKGGAWRLTWVVFCFAPAWTLILAMLAFAH